jgi:mannose-6-phosphate isomerase-like protein (cupin superfamily)
MAQGEACTFVIEGSHIVTLDGEEVSVGAGQECVIPRGTRIAGKAFAGTHTIHAFGGARAKREPSP